MQRARSPEDFAQNPLGRFWLGTHQLVWCTATACGSVHWGEPTIADARDLTRALEVAQHPDLAQGVDVFIDCTGIVAFEWRAFETLLQYAQANVPRWSHRIHRQVVVIGEGPVGAQLAGMAPLIGATFPMHVVNDRESAAAWLGWADADPARRALAVASAIAEQARASDSIVHRLRVWLDGAVAIATVDEAATALGRSSRTLQRELASANTSFSEELANARVRMAASRLRYTDDKIEVIAREVGYTTASRLAATFRRHKGMTPSRYRAASATDASRASRTLPEAETSARRTRS